MNTIYAYRIKNDQYSNEYRVDQPTLLRRHDVKIGFTSRTADERIAEQANASTNSPLIKISEWQIDESFGIFDRKVHNELLRMGYTHLCDAGSGGRMGEEWFNIPSVDDDEMCGIILQSIQRASTPTAGRCELELTKLQFEQLEIAGDVLLGRDDSTILMELCPRFGKTLWALCLHTMMPTPIMVVSSYWLSSLTSFRNEILKFVQFESMCYINMDDSDYFDQVQKALSAGKKIVLDVSLCGNPDVIDNKRKALQPLIDLNSHWVVVDEADFGAHTPRSGEFIDFLCGPNNTKLVLMTGTNAVRASNGRTIDHHSCVTYLDMLVAKNNNISYTSFYSPPVPFVMNSLIVKTKNDDTIKTI